MDKMLNMIILGVVMYFFAWFQAYVYYIKPLKRKLKCETNNQDKKNDKNKIY